MAVDNFEVIDVISIDLNGNAVLTIADHLEWDDNCEHLLILQNKINAYLSAIEGGSFYKSYPDANGRNIIINLVSKYEPNNVAIKFLGRTNEVLEAAGYGFTVRVLKD